MAALCGWNREFRQAWQAGGIAVHSYRCGCRERGYQRLSIDDEYVPFWDSGRLSRPAEGQGSLHDAGARSGGGELKRDFHTA